MKAEKQLMDGIRSVQAMYVMDLLMVSQIFQIGLSTDGSGVARTALIL